MKNEQVFKTFSALSFDGKGVTGEGAPAPSDFQPWLTLESARKFNVHQEGFAAGKLPQPERELPHDRPHCEESRAMLRRRHTASYGSTTPYHRWGINE